ncbi:MAG TPA: DUF6689 family protein [Thermoanaerobaculia bacterium]|jgi:hypothetical protein|nr:DUF6689 family protein [Thermoanaerobaculia bacterium]
MKNRLDSVLFSLLLLSASPVPGFAQTALVPTISGNELTARVELADSVAADLTITFEKVVGLNPSALALSATIVNPGDLTLLSRLPSGVSVPTGFPVVVRIDPTSSSALAFEGVYNLSLYTHNLTLGANSPLRLYRAPGGGSFQDMTGYLQAGSVRAGGSGPGFSEFLIAADTREVDSVIAGKFDTLQSQLSGNSSAITATVAADLQQRLNQARAAYDTGALAAAIDGVAGFGDEVKKQSGAAVPNVWRANGGPTNVAGALRSSADTLKYSLVFKSNLTPLP